MRSRHGSRRPEVSQRITAIERVEASAGCATGAIGRFPTTFALGVAMGVGNAAAAHGGGAASSATLRAAALAGGGTGRGVRDCDSAGLAIEVWLAVATGLVAATAASPTLRTDAVAADGAGRSACGRESAGGAIAVFVWVGATAGLTGVGATGAGGCATAGGLRSTLALASVRGTVARGCGVGGLAVTGAGTATATACFTAAVLRTTVLRGAGDACGASPTGFSVRARRGWGSLGGGTSLMQPSVMCAKTNHEPAQAASASSRAPGFVDRQSQRRARRAMAGRQNSAKTMPSRKPEICVHQATAPKAGPT